MLIEAAHRAETAAKDMLSLVNDESASSAEIHEMLKVSNAAVAMIKAAQTTASGIIAKRHEHGDGGAQVLADAAGLTQREAFNQVKTAKAIAAVPVVREAVESGRVSQANAKQLADALSKTSATDVAADGDLLAKAESMRPEQFAREARRWTADHQSDGGESEYRRQRARRWLRVWDGDDGMVQLHGELDPITGKRIANRLRHQAGLLHSTDKAACSSDRQRTFDQCMADALDNLTGSHSTRSSKNGGSGGFADICVGVTVDEATGKLIAELPSGERLPQAVFEQLTCNSKLTGVVFDRKGQPIWRTVSRRCATEHQWRQLIAKWGGCFHCGAHPGISQAHHIKPHSQGGPTSLDNLVPVCWTCHNRIHEDKWWINKNPDGWHTLHPPGTNQAPAGTEPAAEHTPPQEPDTQHDPDPPDGSRCPARSGKESHVRTAERHQATEHAQSPLQAQLAGLSHW